MRPGSRAPQSILVTTGEEVTAIITPVSICMALTVALVKTLNPTGRSDGHAVSIASVYYTEQVQLERLRVDMRHMFPFLSENQVFC